MTVLSSIQALNNLMCTNIVVFWGTAKIYNTLVTFGSVRCRTRAWSVVIFCSEGGRSGILEPGFLCQGSCIIKTWHILSCSAENEKYLALSEFS